MKKEKRTVFTNGCFEWFHPGHLHLLKRAKLLGDRLVVGVDNDAEFYKSRGRDPIINDVCRAEIVRTCRYVDEVYLFGPMEPNHKFTLMDLMRQVDPYIIVKGSDYVDRPVKGAQEYPLVFIPRLPHWSTSSLMDRSFEHLYKIFMLDGGKNNADR